MSKTLAYLTKEKIAGTNVIKGRVCGVEATACAVP